MRKILVLVPILIIASVLILIFASQLSSSAPKPVASITEADLKEKEGKGYRSWVSDIIKPKRNAIYILFKGVGDKKSSVSVGVFNYSSGELIAFEILPLNGKWILRWQTVEIGKEYGVAVVADGSPSFNLEVWLEEPEGWKNR